MYIVNGERIVRQFIAGVGGVTNGDLVVNSSGTVIKATDPVTAGTLVGIALEDVASGGLVMVDVITAGTTVLSRFVTTGTKKTFAGTDIGLVYDLADSRNVDPDDTTGGCALIAGYDNDTLEVTFNVPASLLYV